MAPRFLSPSADRLWYLASAFCTFPLDFAEGNNFVTLKGGLMFLGKWLGKNARKKQRLSQS